MSSTPPPDAAAQNAAGLRRAKEARAFGAEIARGGYYSRRLFAGSGATAVRLCDPVAPVSHLIVTRVANSRTSARFVEQLFAAVHEASPKTRLMAFEFADYPGFRSSADDWRTLTNHRTMAARVASYRGVRRVQAGPWFDLPHALPWPYFRDVLIPFLVARGEGNSWGFAQPFHGAIFAPLQHWLVQAFTDDEPCFSAFCAEAGSGSLHANHQDQGGGIIAVTPSLAIVGIGMSRPMKDALRQWHIDLVEVEVPTETEHVDELFTVLPDPGTACGRALVALSPQAGDSEEPTNATVAGIKRTVGSVCDSLRQRPELRDLRTVELPVRVTGRHTADFNPVNLLSIPVEEGLLCLLGKPNDSALEAEYRAALAEIGKTLGYRIETGFIDLRGVARDHKGSLHCATLDLRQRSPSQTTP